MFASLKDIISSLLIRHFGAYSEYSTEKMSVIYIANGLGDLDLIPGHVILKSKK